MRDMEKSVQCSTGVEGLTKQCFHYSKARTNTRLIWTGKVSTTKGVGEKRGDSSF